MNACKTSPCLRDPSADPAVIIEEIITDAMHRLRQLGDYIDAHMDELSTTELARLLSVHGENTVRLGRLLRDAHVLSGEATDGLLDALGKALDELSTQLGIAL